MVYSADVVKVENGAYVERWSLGWPLSDSVREVRDRVELEFDCRSGFSPFPIWAVNGLVDAFQWKDAAGVSFICFVSEAK